MMIKIEDKCNKYGPCREQEKYEKKHQKYGVNSEGDCCFCETPLLDVYVEILDEDENEEINEQRTH